MQPLLVAADHDRLVGQVELPAVVRRRRPCASLVTSIASLVRSTGSRGERPAGVEPGQQQQLVDELAHPGGLGLDPAERVRDVVRAAGRGWRRASSA